jgi:mono/diheme cytochrome c family protein
MKKLRLLLALGSALLLCFGILNARQNPTPKAKDSNEIPYNPTPEDIAKKNPIPLTAEGLAEARKLFGYHCAMCHGKDGDGKGDLAATMKLELHDWRDASTIANKTDGELFYIVSNGKGKMLGGEGDRTTEKVRWNLVHLVRSFGHKDAGEKEKKPAS